MSRQTSHKKVSVKRKRHDGDSQRMSAAPRLALGGTSNNKTHSFIRRVRLSNVIQSTAAGVTGSLYFSLGSLPNYTEFTTLFDQYRIRKIAVAFVPQANAIPNNVTPGGTLTTVLDYDDANALANENAAFQYESAVTTPVYQSNRRILRPRLATAAYSGTFTSYTNMNNDTWIDSSSYQVQYYGLKYWLSQANGGANPGAFDVLATYVVECRNTR